MLGSPRRPCTSKFLCFFPGTGHALSPPFLIYCFHRKHLTKFVIQSHSPHPLTTEHNCKGRLRCRAYGQTKHRVDLKADQGCYNKRHAHASSQKPWPWVLRSRRNNLPLGTTNYQPLFAEYCLHTYLLSYPVLSIRSSFHPRFGRMGLIGRFFAPHQS